MSFLDYRYVRLRTGGGFLVPAELEQDLRDALGDKALPPDESIQACRFPPFPK